MESAKPAKLRPNVEDMKVVDPDTLHWECEIWIIRSPVTFATQKRGGRGSGRCKDE